MYIYIIYIYIYIYISVYIYNIIFIYIDNIYIKYIIYIYIYIYLSVNQHPEVFLINDSQVFAWYFKKDSKYSDRIGQMQLKSDTIGLSSGNLSANLCILGSP